MRAVRFLLATFVLCAVQARCQSGSKELRERIAVFDAVGNLEAKDIDFLSRSLSSLAQSQENLDPSEYWILDKINFGRALERGGFPTEEDVARQGDSLHARFVVTAWVDSSLAGWNLELSARDLASEGGGQSIWRKLYSARSREELLGLPKSGAIDRGIWQAIRERRQQDTARALGARSILVVPFEFVADEPSAPSPKEKDRLFNELAAQLQASDICLAFYDKSRKPTSQLDDAREVANGTDRRKILYGSFEHRDTGWTVRFRLLDKTKNRDIVRDSLIRTVGFPDLVPELVPSMVRELGYADNDEASLASAADLREQRRQAQLASEKRHRKIVQTSLIAGGTALLLLGAGTDCLMEWHLCKESPEETSTMKVRW